MKKNIILIIVGITFVFIFIFKFIQNVKKGELNAISIEGLQKGVTLEKALQVMGTPDNIRKHSIDSSVIVYFYEPPVGASDGIYFYIDSTNRVIEIIPSE